MVHFLLGWCSGDHRTPYLCNRNCCTTYLYLLNLHHIITPADVSPNGNAIHTPISP